MRSPRFPTPVLPKEIGLGSLAVNNFVPPPPWVEKIAKDYVYETKCTPTLRINDVDYVLPDALEDTDIQDYVCHPCYTIRCIHGVRPHCRKTVSPECRELLSDEEQLLD